MKTQVVLQSSDRNLFGITIRQNTKDSMLSITDLQKAYDKARWMYGWNDKRISDILSTLDAKQRIYYILKELCLVTADIFVFMEMVDKEGITKTLKTLGVYKTTGRGENKQVVANPYIWVLIAMELNPMLYAKVVIWITDTLVFDRLEAGSEYLPMNTAIKSIVKEPNFPRYAILINEKVFGFHKSGMRNLASARELRRITELEELIINLIELGFVKSEDDIIKAIQNHKFKK